ncbi:MAG: M3 family oligoendopeptidase [Phycisphaerae bacterium]|nr:M3 family oligoendopeptidase [Phycisphaerae bacterium]
MADASPAAEFPREYVAVDADFGTWETAEPYFKELSERSIETVEELEKWLIDDSELEACFDEEGMRRYTAMTCQTNDEQRQQRYLHFIENVQPHAEPWHDILRRKFVAAAEKLDLPKKRYEVFERSMRNAIELYREENIPLLVENQKLSTEYQTVIAAMTCEYDGQEQTLQQLARYLEEPDRKVRAETWRLGSDRFLQDAERLDKLYEQMVALRHQIALNAGCQDYREYAFKGMERFDYTPEDCLAFHEAIEQVCVPATMKLAEERKQKLGVATLRPWDMAVDPEGRPPLRPFQTDEELARGCGKIFHQVEPELGQVFDILRERGSLDLGSRKGKAPGGYQTAFAERRLPFIFMNAVGTESDVRTLLHEGGHAFHTWACRQEPFIAYRGAPLEFAEVASMSMECLALPHTNEFFGEETKRATRRFFEKIVTFFPFMACVDAFQHYVYTHVDAGIEAWKDYWQSLTRRFAPELDLSGLERQNRQSWQKKLHIYEVPFYYVEYGIAQLGALQIWKNSREDYSQAVAQYRNGLSLGGSRPLPELFEAAGCKFDFTEQTLRPLIEAVGRVIR